LSYLLIKISLPDNKVYWKILFEQQYLYLLMLKVRLALLILNLRTFARNCVVLVVYYSVKQNNVVLVILSLV
jgi:hypothetical protein